MQTPETATETRTPLNRERVLHAAVALADPEGLEALTMRRRAGSTRAALNRHRWAVGLMEGRAKAEPASVRLHEAVLGCLREAGFSVAMTVQAYSVQDAYIYGFALQEKALPFESAEESAAVAEEQAWDAEALAAEFPYLAEVVAGHVAKVGYDFTEAFEYGLDLILDALERRRDRA